MPCDFLRPLPPRLRAVSIVVDSRKMTRALVDGMAGVSRVLRRTCCIRERMDARRPRLSAAMAES